MAFDMVNHIANQSKKLGNAVAQIGRKSIGFTTLNPLHYDDLEIWDCRKVESHQNIAGEALMWDHSSFGLWDTGKWADVAISTFIIGHVEAGVLGTSKLGSTASDFETIGVSNAHNLFPEGFWNERFKDDTTTADWGTDICSFTNGEFVLSTSIYLNGDTVTNAIMTAKGTDYNNLTFYMSANGGTNWEEVNLSSLHTFTNTGTDLRWKAVSAGTCSLTYVEVKYNIT